MMLLRLIKSVQGHADFSSIIVVPAYFRKLHIEATITAAVTAEMTVKSTINKPTAAAIAYGLEKRTGLAYYITFDLGATLEVSLLSIEDGNIIVLEAVFDRDIGGKIFDQSIAQDIQGTASLATYERAKIELSESTSTTVEGKKLTRERFEEINQDLFTRCIAAVDKVLGERDLTRINVQEVVLIGGGTRMPKIREILSSTFPGKTINYTIDAQDVEMNRIGHLIDLICFAFLQIYCFGHSMMECLVRDWVEVDRLQPTRI
eukprot:gene12131-14194_t